MDADKLHLKKIKIEKLEVGMFIVNMDRSWFKHPFLSSKKMITSEKQIEKLREYGVQEVYIDQEKGHDVPASETEEQSPDPPPQPIKTERSQDVMASKTPEKSPDPPVQAIALERNQDVVPREPAEKSPNPPAQIIVGVKEEVISQRAGQSLVLPA